MTWGLCPACFGSLLDGTSPLREGAVPAWRGTNLAAHSRLHHPLPPRLPCPGRPPPPASRTQCPGPAGNLRPLPRSSASRRAVSWTRWHCRPPRSHGNASLGGSGAWRSLARRARVRVRVGTGQDGAGRQGRPSPGQRERFSVLQWPERLFNGDCYCLFKKTNSFFIF